MDPNKFDKYVAIQKQQMTFQLTTGYLLDGMISEIQGLLSNWDGDKSSHNPDFGTLPWNNISLYLICDVMFALIFNPIWDFDPD